MVTLDAESYVDAAARAVGIALRPVERRDVVIQFERIHAHARLVLDFDLGSEDELAPRFEP